MGEKTSFLIWKDKKKKITFLKNIFVNNLVNFAPINEHEAKDYDFLNPSSVPYYYSPSSTVMRQQKLLQIQQHQHHQHQQHEANQVATSTPTSERSKSTNRTAHGSSTEHGRTARVKSAQASSRAALQWSSNQESDGAKSKKNEPKQTRNTSIKKLKSFFGERTPVVLQAVESKNVIASDDYLAGQPNQTVKEGVLICKMVLKDGKRSPDRSWRPAWAVLKRSGELFLCKEKKDNVMVPSMDSAYPISVKNSLIDIAYDYTKRKNVFKIRSVNCEYLFQTIDHDSMLEWIRVMQESANDSLDKLVTCMSSSNKNWLVNTIESEHNSLDLSAHSPPVLHSRKSMHNSAEAVNWSPDDSYSRGRAATDTDVSPRRADNRKWVRQMTRRIKDFMGSASAEPMAHEQYAAHGRNFGIALERCEPSTLGVFVPVVIEVCTRLVECHIVDEGLYRKVGQKQVVLALRSQLNAGVMSVDVSDHNWDNPHAVVSLLKCFLNELPDSLTTSHLYNEFIHVCRSDQHHGRIVGVKRLLNKLPKHNYETLKYLTAHLRRVAAAYQHNKMTIKNLSIAFSQSIIRHNEANCETIRSDHLAQSLLIELILIYAKKHDWLFDPSQTENIPMEIKDSAEQHLSQQYCSYIEPIAYSDLLINIIKLLRSRWNSTNSTMNTPSNTHHSNDSGYYSNLNANRQPINIQFKSV
ncbi:rho GTPase-activating 21-like isoform X1 [Brachionus plicatilis]|uniref:Rho GTPase-activating 21-like isoform X1 n=1 Tax=Brachionus plicatilis TaxID=10195 RepID=A0A3M7TAB0_BRAPC|nr:rho GTPase-activating 21-like isoform X1 [Brachionus plicatilis]